MLPRNRLAIVTTLGLVELLAAGSHANLGRSRGADWWLCRGGIATCLSVNTVTVPDPEIAACAVDIGIQGSELIKCNPRITSDGEAGIPFCHGVPFSAALCSPDFGRVWSGDVAACRGCARRRRGSWCGGDLSWYDFADFGDADMVSDGSGYWSGI